MMLSLSLFALASIQTSYAFSVAPAMLTRPSVTAMRMAEVFDQEQFNTKGKEMRLAHLEEQAMYALKINLNASNPFATPIVCFVPIYSE